MATEFPSSSTCFLIPTVFASVKILDAQAKTVPIIPHIPKMDLLISPGTNSTDKPFRQYQNDMAH